MPPFLIRSVFILIFVMLSACGGRQAEPPPEWINKPGDGAVGSSGTHIRGRHYQEDLAIARARERLAARYGVEVESVHTIREKVVNDSAYVSSQKEIKQRVNKTTVRAHVRAVWRNKLSDEVWVWVYPVSD